MRVRLYAGDISLASLLFSCSNPTSLDLLYVGLLPYLRIISSQEIRNGLRFSTDALLLHTR